VLFFEWKVLLVLKRTQVRYLTAGHGAVEI
jgi:hypothetical protein